MRELNLRSLIQPSKTLSFELTGTHLFFFFDCVYVVGVKLDHIFYSPKKKKKKMIWPNINTKNLWNFFLKKTQVGLGYSN